MAIKLENLLGGSRSAHSYGPRRFIVIACYGAMQGVAVKPASTTPHTRALLGHATQCPGALYGALLRYVRILYQAALLAMPSSSR
jgi:hypothetical protein